MLTSRWRGNPTAATKLSCSTYCWRNKCGSRSSLWLVINDDIIFQVFSVLLIRDPVWRFSNSKLQWWFLLLYKCQTLGTGGGAMSIMCSWSVRWSWEGTLGYNKLLCWLMLLLCRHKPSHVLVLMSSITHPTCLQLSGRCFLSSLKSIYQCIFVYISVYTHTRILFFRWSSLTPSVSLGNERKNFTRH